jgi:hypothetical protein
MRAARVEVDVARPGPMMEAITAPDRVAARAIDLT